MIKSVADFINYQKPVDRRPGPVYIIQKGMDKKTSPRS
jgi:hypothetical protein